MKKILFILILIAFSYNVYSKYRPNGGCFTPKGEFKMLVVFVGFGDNDELLDVANWPAGQEFPNEVIEGKLFYDNFDMFDTTIDSARDVENVSRW